MNPILIEKLIRAYTFHTPVKKGIYRLSDLALKLSSREHGKIEVRSSDRRRLMIDTRNSSYKYLYFTGTYEDAITRLFSQIVKPGDVCLDIGANIGWFTTLFQKLAGSDGEVHAFEPVPPTYKILQENVQLNVPPQNVTINQLALSDTSGTVDLHIFDDLPDGHASIATFEHEDFTSYQVEMTTLDSYLAANGIDNVAVVKMDIEGAELMMLKGASSLFKQRKLPILEVEMALATSRGFGYVPNDLLEIISQNARYNFYAIDEKAHLLDQVDGFAPDDPGANVLCLPEDFDPARLTGWFR